MYNKVILMGRLTKDPELRYTSSGKAVASFRLAVDRGVGGGQGERETDFIDIVVWDKQAETVSQYLTKGRAVLVDGRLQMRQYDAQDGTRRTVYEVVAQTVRFLPDGSRGGGGAPGGGMPGRQGGGSAGAGDGGFSDFTPDDEDVPF